MKILRLLLLVSLVSMSAVGYAEGRQDDVWTDPETDLIGKNDTIVGNFSGNGIDTLISEPIDTLHVVAGDPNDAFSGKHYKWRIRSVRKTVKDIIVHNTIGIHFVNEGDLDGNGTDEFGFKEMWPTSNWHQYFIYTYDKGEWKYLVKPFVVWNDDYYERQNGGQDVAKPARKGHITIGYSEITKDGDFLFKEKTIAVRKILIPQVKDVFPN